MNLAERLDQYQNRGFRPETTAINLFLEEALQILFSRFPGAFVFYGGASLVLFYGSSRHSGDLDLLLNSENPPPADQLLKALEHPLRATAEALGFEKLTIAPSRTANEFGEFVVEAGGSVLFTIQLTRISAVIRSEVVELHLPSDPTIPISVPSRNLHLLLKAETFLKTANSENPRRIRHQGPQGFRGTVGQ